MCSFVPEGCGTLCDVHNVPCAEGPVDPTRTIEICNEDGSRIEEWTSYPLWCCKDCYFGLGSCFERTNLGGVEHTSDCPAAGTGNVREPGAHTCGLGICEAPDECAAPGEPPTCTPYAPAPYEDCENGLDDDCDGATDCADADCQEPAEDCENGIDDNCDGQADCDDDECLFGPELCLDGIDNNCDPLDDDDPLFCFDPEDDAPNNGRDDDGSGGPDDPRGPDKCDDCGACRGAPVHLRTRQMFAGPHEDAHIHSDNGGTFDLVFARVYDSDRAASDERAYAGPLSPGSVPRLLPFGPGWRHSFDDRLILRGPDAPEDPISVVYEHPMGHVRLFPTGPGTYGRAPGRAIALQRDGDHWRLVQDNGDVLVFAESGVTTRNHPWGDLSPLDPEQGPQFHLRLIAIHPSGVLGYRHRLWHEQDADIPAGVCAHMPGGACDPARGLLVAVAMEWLEGETWRRGPSLHLRWEYLPGYFGDAPPPGSARDQHVLKAIVDGADVEAQRPDPEVLVEYRAAAANRQLPWQWRLGEVRSGLGGHQDARGAQKMRLVYDDAAPWLLSAVERPAMGSDDAIVLVPEETFLWEQLDDGTWAVGAHQSQGVELAASQAPLGASGVMSWTENGRILSLRFEEGRPVECLDGDCGRVGSSRRQMFSVENDRYLLGVSASPRPDGSWLLRDFDEQGHTVLEADVFPDAGAEPTMARQVKGGVEEVTFAGVAELRRVSRSYTTADDPARVLATATRAAYQSTTTILFPSDAGLPRSWAYVGTASERPVVQHRVLLLGAPHFFDVDVFDADTDGDGKLNEAEERMVLWRHHARTDASGGGVYRSERERRSAAGQLLDTTHFATRRGGGPMRVVGKTERDYFSTDATDARQRGRLRAVKLFPNAGSGRAAFHAWVACTGGYDREGRLLCRVDEERDPRDPRWYATTTEREVLEILPTGVQRRTRSARAAQSFLAAAPATWEERLASGVLIATGVVGGNSTQYRVDPAASATQGPRPNQVRVLDAAGTVLQRESLDYGPSGRLDSRAVVAGATPGTPERYSTFDYDAEGRVETVTAYADPVDLAQAARTRWEYSPGSDLLLSMTEPDGTVVENSYVDGRLAEVRRDRRLVAGYSYDSQGRMTEARNATSPALRLSYGADGELAREENLAAGWVVEHEEDVAVLGDDAYRVVRTTHRSPGPQGAVHRDVETYFDNLGRAMMACDLIGDPLCAAPIAEYFYGGKGAYVGVYTTGSGRTVNLSDAFDHGRLSYVTHEAGATFLVYDAAGRVVTRVQHEGALPATLPATAPLLRAVDYQYGPDGTLAQMRYPSNRAVQYLFGDDKRAPISVRVALQTSAPQTFNELVGDVAPALDGVPTSWSWRTRTGLLARYLRSLDGLGRVTSQQATLLGVPTIRLSYRYEADGAVRSQTDGTAASSLPGGVPEVSYDEDDIRDMLTRWRAVVPWNDSLVSDVRVTDIDALGRRQRVTSQAGPSAPTIAVSFDYDANWPERLVGVRRLGASSTPSLASLARLSYDGVGQVTGLSYGLPAKAQTFVYGPRGEVVHTTSTSGTSAHLHSDTMERWRRSGPVQGFFERFRYGAAGELIDDERAGRSVRPHTGKTFARDEFVYLGGAKIAAIHTETARPQPEVALLFADRLGTVRHMTTTDLRPLARIDTDVWGNGSVHDERTSRALGAIPNVGERLPGQYADGPSTFGAVENRWRFYLPWAGGYTSPDPEYRAGVSGQVGAQAYAYADGNPNRFLDPTGRYALDASWEPFPARKQRAQLALTAIRNDKLCKCAFKEGYGRLPFDDAFGVHLGLSPFCGPTNGGCSPFTTLINSPLAYPQYYQQLATYARVDIAERVADDPQLGFLRMVLAHEMTHTSFNVRDVIGRFPEPAAIGALCSGFGSIGAVPDGVRKCCQCDP